MDEVQYTIPKSWYKPIIFESEEQAKEYNNTLPTPLHFSDKLGKWYLDGDNDLNKIIGECTEMTKKILDIQVELGYEYSCGNSWAETH